MKKIVLAVAVLALCVSATFADNTDTLTINYEVEAINVVDITAEAITLTIDSATAGSEPDQASADTTYAITTNQTDRKLTGAIDTAMPENLTLKATAAAPTGADAVAEAPVIGVEPADLVTGIGEVAQSGLSLDFTLDATVDAGIVESASKTFTLTLVDGA